MLYYDKGTDTDAERAALEAVWRTSNPLCVSICTFVLLKQGTSTKVQTLTQQALLAAVWHTLNPLEGSIYLFYYCKSTNTDADGSAVVFFSGCLAHTESSRGLADAAVGVCEQVLDLLVLLVQTYKY